MFILPVVCPRCDGVVHLVERKTKRVEKIVGAILCDSCKINSLTAMRERERSPKRKQENSSRMKERNPMFSPISRAKMVSTVTGIDVDVDEYLVKKKDLPKPIVETRDERAARMRLNNPMYNELSMAKSRATIQNRIASGELDYLRGPDHWLWKGNRDFANSCRRDLYPVWTFPVLERDQFRCTKCDSSERLQVHHLKPLREFISEIKEKYKIVSFENMTAEEFHPYVIEVVSNHRLDDGITLCPKCHSEVDMYFFGHGQRRTVK